jgi:hypothetical protein
MIHGTISIAIHRRHATVHRKIVLLRLMATTDLELLIPTMYVVCGIAQSVQRLATKFDSKQGARDYVFSATSRLALGQTSYLPNYHLGLLP